MRVEDEFTDVLQNTEVLVSAMFRRHPEISDYTVRAAYEALAEHYKAEKIGRMPHNSDLSMHEQELFGQLLSVCEWRLGRSEMALADPNDESEPPPPITVDDLLRCMKRLLKSLRTWSKGGGRKGYLEYISHFV